MATVQGLNIDMGQAANIARLRQIRKQRDLDEETKTLVDSILSSSGNKSQLDFNDPNTRRLMTINPQVFKTVNESLGNIGGARKKAFFQDANQALLFQQAGRDDMALDLATKRRDMLSAMGADTSHTDEYITLLQQGKPGEAKSVIEAIVSSGVASGMIDAPDPNAFQTFAPRLNESTGMYEVVRANKRGDVNTVDTGIKGETQLQREEREIRTTQRKDAAKRKEKRISDITTEISENARLASRSEVKIEQALRLVESASQGLTGAAKFQLARVFPGINVEDEGQLMAAFNQLAIDELQLFKGPTTDFEFGVTQSIPGRISDPRSANRARLKSLKRAKWFVKKEQEQFSRYIAGDNNPDEFSFNIDEVVATKQGNFTLRDLLQIAAESNLTMEELLAGLGQ